MANKGAHPHHKYATPRESTEVRRQENKRRRSEVKSVIRNVVHTQEFEDLEVPLFKGTEGWISW